MTCHWRGDHLSNFQIRYNQIRDGKISGFCLVMVVMTDIIHSVQMISQKLDLTMRLSGISTKRRN